MSHPISKRIFYIRPIDPQCCRIRPIFTYVHNYHNYNNNLKSVLITVSGDRAPVREDYYAGYDGGT